jgi:excisionase family DNA binding protein
MLVTAIHDTVSVREESRIMEELFTVMEVAEWLKVRQRTVKRWLLSGQLHGLKAGRK